MTSKDDVISEYDNVMKLKSSLIEYFNSLTYSSDKLLKIQQLLNSISLPKFGSKCKEKMECDQMP